MTTLIPGTLPNGVRRRVPKVGSAKVPLWTLAPEGEAIEGIIRVPTKWCGFPEHTNEHNRLKAWITQWVDQWVDWRRKRGWILNSEVEVFPPHNPPENDARLAKAYQEQAEIHIGKSAEVRAITEYDAAEEYQIVDVKAYFKREVPVYANLDDVLELRHMALQYGIDPDRDPATLSPEPEAKDFLAFNGGLDPLKVAEERRKRLGLRRKDYLIGKLRDPL